MCFVASIEVQFIEAMREEPHECYLSRLFPTPEVYNFLIHSFSIGYSPATESIIILCSHYSYLPITIFYKPVQNSDHMHRCVYVVGLCQDIVTFDTLFSCVFGNVPLAAAYNLDSNIR